MQLQRYFNPVFIRHSLFVVLVLHSLVYYSSKHLLLLCHIRLFIKINITTNICWNHVFIFLRTIDVLSAFDEIGHFFQFISFEIYFGNSTVGQIQTHADLTLKLIDLRILWKRIIYKSQKSLIF